MYAKWRNLTTTNEALNWQKNLANILLTFFLKYLNCKTFECVCCKRELYFISFINISAQTGNTNIEMKET